MLLKRSSLTCKGITLSIVLVLMVSGMVKRVVRGRLLEVWGVSCLRFVAGGCQLVRWIRYGSGKREGTYSEMDDCWISVA